MTDPSGRSMALDPVDAYTRASALFGGVVTRIADDDWDIATWPDDWTALTTVAWVVVGDAQVPLAVSGGRVDPPRDFDAGVIGSSPIATWRGTALAAIAALRSDGALQRRFSHPGGDLVVGDLVGQRVSENLVRAHDLASALDRRDALADDPVDELADWCLEFWAGHASAVLAGGVLPGAVVAPPPGSGSMTRLLALTGRLSSESSDSE